MDLVDLIVETRDAIKATCQKYGAYNVRIFGSCARDDYNENSDIDILVDFNDRLDLGVLCDLEDELQKLLGRKVDLGSESMLRPRVREDVLRDAVAL
jgi:uncharacterized protein